MSAALRAVVDRNVLSSHAQTDRGVARGRFHFSRMRLMAGVVLICLSAMLGNIWFSQTSTHIQVFVMAKNLAAGSVITSTDFEVRSLTPQYSGTYVTDQSDIIGQRLSRDLFAGELIPQSALLSVSEADLREVSIPLSAGHSPFVDTGSLVDVWMTPSADGVALPGPAQLILPNAVIKTGLMDADPTLDSVVTVTVPAGDVHLVVEAMQSGTISLVAVSGNLRPLEAKP